MVYNSTEYYFTNKINIEYTWLMFTEFYHRRKLKGKFEIMNNGISWRDNIAYHQDGRVLFINENNESYKGLWFVMDKTRIVIFDKSSKMIL